jgi:spore germination protein YaaH
VDWNRAFDREALAKHCDGLMIMGYDYHWSGSPYSGAVAPLTGGSYNVTNTVNDYITASRGQRDKLVLGVPYYGYEWKTESNKPGARVLAKEGSRTYQQAETAAAHYGKRWDALTQTPWYAFNDGTNWHQCWYDDSLSLSLKYNLVLAKIWLGSASGRWATTAPARNSGAPCAITSFLPWILFLHLSQPIFLLKPEKTAL